MGQKKQEPLRLGRLGTDMTFGAVADDSGVRLYDITNRRRGVVLTWTQVRTLATRDPERTPFEELIGLEPKTKKPPGP